MRHDLFISGYGGQGVLLAGTVLSYAAILEGKNVSFLPSYGPEKRGGSAMCTMVITDGEVGSPVVGSPSVGILMNQLSLDKYCSKIKPRGICIINSSLADPERLDVTGLDLISIPMNEVAMSIGDSRLANMVALGAYTEVTGVVCRDSIAQALVEALPERNHKFIPINIKALEAGADIVKNSRTP
jgi:2-oxoglutarate ferredoxin oxidoreductase subunit gamma